MDFNCDLEEEMHGHENPLFEKEVDELSEYEFGEMVRKTVEAIILPHLDILELVEEKGGQIQFLDVWQQTFTEELKEEVRKRDGFKCVV
ncbi:hypothetical protein [Solibacillus sp. FSL H8-0538]|uniref:hypothetical protein n=1 Tax=Solibacillus sp. FSL H8-0538 TaxID=2921400 RepID=UPI0030F5FA1F